MTFINSRPPQMTRFYYRIRHQNKYGLIWALSKLDALRQVAYSEDMTQLQHVEWLTE